MDDFVAQMEAIKADSKLSPDERKKALKSLKRKMRRAAIKTGDHVPTHRETPAEKATAEAAITFDELVKTVEDYYGGKCERVDPKTLGYAFSLRQAANLKVHDPAAFEKKFTTRWGYAPTNFFTLHKGMDVLLFLGPVHSN